MNGAITLYTASQIATPVKSGHCALARADPVFGTDEKRIRAKNKVMDKSKGGSGWLLYEIGDPRGRVFVRAKSQLWRSINPATFYRCSRGDGLLHWLVFGRHRPAGRAGEVA